MNYADGILTDCEKTRHKKAGRKVTPHSTFVSASCYFSEKDGSKVDSTSISFLSVIHLTKSLSIQTF